MAIHRLPRRGSACNAIALSHTITAWRPIVQCSLEIFRSPQCPITCQADSVPVGPQVYKGPPSPSWLHALIFSFPLTRPACIVFPSLSVATEITMASSSDTIIITDDKELPRLEAGSSRPRRAPRRDYSYRDFESMIVEAVDYETDTTPSRKRKRTETEEPSALVLVPHNTFFVLN